MNNSLKGQLFKITLVPILFLTAIIIAVSVSILYNSMVEDVKEELMADADLVILMYDKVYTGDFTYEVADDGSIVLYKGGKVITGDDSILSNLAERMDIEISLCLADKRLITTLKNPNGSLATGTSCSPVVENQVLNTGESVFYSNVSVYDEKSYAYYKPLISDDGTVYGMVEVCRTSKVVLADAFSKIWPIVFICLVAAIGIAAIISRFTKKLVLRIYKLDNYVDSLAEGDFTKEPPREIMLVDDELKHLANGVKYMSRAMQTLVEYDALTGLFNRRAGEKRLQEIRKKSEKTGSPYCVCIGDIDYFKKFNDSFGHETGDDVLKLVSAELKNDMQTKGFAARWGGEEFLLIFEDCRADEAIKSINEILDNIRKIQIPDVERQITMSFGMVQADKNFSNDDNLKHADQNLYKAKESGRDRVVG